MNSALIKLNTPSKNVSPALEPLTMHKRFYQALLHLAPVLIMAGGLSVESSAASAPACPGNSVTPYPAFSKAGSPPEFDSWRNLPGLPSNCHIKLTTPAMLTVALAGEFIHNGPIETIAARLGAISETRNLPYWSVTDNAWRNLVSDAFALSSPDKKTDRADFSAAEMLGSQNKYFAQNDTRSWGLNVYRFATLDSSAGHLTVLLDNVSSVRLGPVTLLQPHDGQTVLFINRIDDTRWSYYSIAVIKNTPVAAREKSLINRQAAFYRYLIKQAPDENPPLSP